MENLQKELEERQGGRIAATAGIVVVFLIIGMAISTALTSAPANEPKKGAYLQIEDVFFLLESKGSERVSIGVSAFITNSGSADAESVEIVAFVIEKNSNLALDRSTITVGTIGKYKTKMTDFSLSMPDDDSYTIRLILMESGKISIRGSGIVNLDFHGGGSGTRFATDSDGVGETNKEGLREISFADGGSAFPVWFVLGVLLALVLFIAAVRSTSTKKRPNAISSDGLNSDYHDNEANYFSEGKDPLSENPVIEEDPQEHLENEEHSEIEENQDVKIKIINHLQ